MARSAKADLVQKIVELRQQGLSFQEIAKRLGIAASTAWRYYKKWEEEQKKQQEEQSRNNSKNFETLQSFLIQELSQVRNLLHGVLEHVRTLEQNFDSIVQELQRVKNFQSTLLQAAKLRVEGPTKCKYLDEFGYCTRVLLEYCPPDLQCLEVLTEGSVKLYRPKVIQNPVICIACPYYTPRKK